MHSTLGTADCLINTYVIEQGDVDDCWLVAAAAGLTATRPNFIPSIIHTNLDATFDVDIAGRTANVGLAANGQYSTANGDWLQVLERGYARRLGMDSRSISGVRRRNI